jgi:hypothetical protein
MSIAYARKAATMEEQIWISDIAKVALSDEYWVRLTDLMGRDYVLDPHVALELAAWVTKHTEEVRKARFHLQMARAREEAALYGPLSHPSPQAQEDDSVTPPTRAPKRSRKPSRKKEET